MEKDQRNDQAIESVIEVNWDEIDKNYIELPSVPSSDGTGFIANPVNSHTQRNGKFQRPHASEEDNFSGLSGTQQSVQKPDGHV